MLARSLLTVLLAIAYACTAQAQTPGDAAARERLHRQQLEDRLRLETQQSVPPRGALAPADARRLEALQRRQRAEQQQLDARELALQRRQTLDPGDGGLRTQQRLLDQERTLQLQRFDLEQRELLRGAQRPPLQRRRRRRFTRA